MSAVPFTTEALLAVPVPEGSGAKTRVTDPDCRGLLLIVLASGKRAWSFRHRTGGSETTHPLGYLPEVSIESARAKAAAIRSGASGPVAAPVHTATPLQRLTAQAVAAGIDVPVADGPTLRTITDYFLAKSVDGKRRVSTARKIRTFLAHLEPLMNRPAAAIRPHDIDDITGRLTKASQFELARRVANTADRVYRLAIRHHDRLGMPLIVSPADTAGDSIREDAKVNELVEHHPALTKESHLGELARGVWEWAKGAETSAPREALKLLMLTALRGTEIFDLRWEFVNWQEKRLELPAAHMKEPKNGACWQPLSAPALAVLRELGTSLDTGPTVPTSGPVFPNYCRDNAGEISNSGVNACNKVLRTVSEWRSIPHSTCHGLRTTFRMLAIARKWGDTELTDLCHAHRVKGIAREYTRAMHTEYRLDEKRELMDRWGALIDKLRVD